MASIIINIALFFLVLFFFAARHDDFFNVDAGSR